jgi:hypothetical protein
MSYYNRCLQTIPGRDIQPQTRRRLLPHMPIYAELLSLADQRDAARRDGDETLAAQLKEQAQQLFDRWFNEQDLRLSLEAEEQKQLTAAREHAGFTALAIDTAAGF